LLEWETVAGINDFVREALLSYSNLSEEMLRFVLVHSGPVILPELGERLGSYAHRKLSGRKVEIRLNTRVEGVSGRNVRLSDGTTIATNTLVWTAGTSPNRLLETVPCAKDHGRLLVTEFLELDAWPGVWALGDCAAVPDPRTGAFHPPTAQHALPQARIVAHNVVAAIRGTQKCRSIIRLSRNSARSGGAPASLALWVSTFRVRCVVALAHHLSKQTSAGGKEITRRLRLDTGLDLFKGLCPIRFFNWPGAPRTVGLETMEVRQSGQLTDLRFTVVR
jgi:NADH dehydrogenase FAD-containing subunit